MQQRRQTSTVSSTSSKHTTQTHTKTNRIHQTRTVLTDYRLQLAIDSSQALGKRPTYEDHNHTETHPHTPPSKKNAVSLTVSNNTYTRGRTWTRCGQRGGMTPRRTSAGLCWKDQKKNGGLARNWASCERTSFRDTSQHLMARWVLGVWGQDLLE